MATSKKTINKAQLNALVESGMSKAEIAKELGLLVGELNLLCQTEPVFDEQPKCRHNQLYKSPQSNLGLSILLI